MENQKLLIDPYILKSDKKNCKIRLALGWNDNICNIMDDLNILLNF